MKHIIIGSKPYYNINLNNLIDNNFTNFYRINISIPGNNNGTKDSDIQYLNCHLYKRYKSNLTPKQYMYHYKELIKDISYIKKYLIYMKKKKIKILYCNGNNTNKFKYFLKRINLNINLTKQLRAGYGLLYYLLERNIKPFIIGFSINNNNSYYKKNKKSKCHDIKKEGILLKKLHERDIIDATFCLLKDNSNTILDCNHFLPTINSLKILVKEYNKVVLENNCKFSNEFILKLKNNFKKIIVYNNSIILLKITP